MAEPSGAHRGRGVVPPEEDSIVSPLADSDDREVERALRPKRLDDFVGQARVREQLTLLLHSALRRGRPRTTCCFPARPASARPRSR